MSHAPMPDRADDVRTPRLELRLARGRVRIGLSPGRIEAGLALLDLELEVQGAPAGFDPGGGTVQFRSLPCSLLRLEVAALFAGPVPGPEALDGILASALAPSGWPAPDAGGLRHALKSDGGVHRALWQRPGAEAMALLESASEARTRGEPDAALKFALAGQAALGAGLPVEGEAALRTALDLGLGRDEARDAWAALVAIARDHADPVGERRALVGLVPASPTGQRPALLLRLSELALSAGDVAAARTHAEEARTLAPRDLAAAETCLAIARQVGDGAAVIDHLDRLAILDPVGAGARLFERARLLAAAGRLAEADAGYLDALSRLPPDRALSDEHTALRRYAPPPVSRLPWGEPLETFASRTPDAAAAARALRDVARVAREQGDLATALRAARKAHEKAGDLFFVGEMLAELLHSGGSVDEALALHVALLDSGRPSADPGIEADRMAALAELAEESGDPSLALRALDRLLELHPHDPEVVAWRFRVDPDRSRALDRLSGDADQVRSRLRRARLLALAARAARTEAGDPARDRALVERAKEAANGLPAAELELDGFLTATGRLADLGRALLDRTARETDPDARARLRLHAAEVLSGAEDEESRALAIPALLAVLAEPPPGRAPLLEAAERLSALGRGEESAPYLLALCRSDPFDGAAARAVARALGSDPRARGEAFLSIASAAPDGPVRAGHLREAAAAFAEAGDATRLREASRATFEAWPVDDLAFRSALADASGDVEATDAILSLRAAQVPTEAAACHLSRADLLLSAGRPGLAARAYESCLASDPADAGAVAGLAEARAAEGDFAGALSAARHASEIAASQGRQVDRRRSLEIGAHVAASVGDRGDDAVVLLEELAVLRLGEGEGGDPEVAQLVSRAASALAQAGEDLRASALLSLAARSDAAAGSPDPSADIPEAPASAPSGDGASIADLLRPLLASARALADGGELGAAYARLKLAREIDPGHLELTLGLARVAEKLGHLEEAVSLGEAYADAIAPADAAGAATRYRELADTARGRLSDGDRAASLLEKAAALDPEDPATAEALASLRASRRAQALDLLASHLATSRERPSDIRAARAVAILSRELSAGEGAGRERAALTERGVVADGLARFLQRLGPAPLRLDLAFGIDAGVRTRIAAPGADGPTARLLTLLAPYLEPLFPVDLGRYGVGPSDRVAPASSPALHGALDSATCALAGRPLALFCGRRPGFYAGLENTRPPSLLLATDVASLPPGAIAFLMARSVALAAVCWPLVGKFAPRDALILCELAVRFAGGEPPSAGLPLDRAGAFLAALDRSVPPSMRDFLGGLGPAGADELGSLDPLAFSSALESTANRLALLHCGDLHGALTVLARLQRPGLAPVPGPAASLDLPDLADLTRFALSDGYLELRGGLLGWP